MNPNSSLLLGAISLVPYAALALGYAILTGGGPRAFATALGFLVGTRLFFAAVEGVGSLLVWRLHGRKTVVAAYLNVLQTNRFPKRYYQHDDFLSYLARIHDDDSLSTEVKAVARDFERALLLHESSGILAGARMHSASELALEQYSPRSRAPTL